MPSQFPHHYRATVTRTHPSRSRVEADGVAPLSAGTSRHFDGDATTWSPEQLLLSSLGTGMLTTFEAFAARDGVEVSAFTAVASGEVERTADGLEFTSIVLSIDLTVGGNVGAVDRALEDAKAFCLILTSLKVPVMVETQVTYESTVAPASRPSYAGGLALVTDDWTPAEEDLDLRAS